MTRALRAAAPVLLSLTTVGLLAGCGGGNSSAAEWALPNGDLAGTRDVAARIDSSNVASLTVAWRFHLRSSATFSGLATATPVIVGKRVYIQDLDSNVFALDLQTGRSAWKHTFGQQSGGPNGVAYADGRIYGSTETTAFALSASTGTLAWRRALTTTAQPITVAPVVADGVVVTSTTGASPGGEGAVIGLDAQTGRFRWRFDTIAGSWSHPNLASGGGVWETPTVDSSGHVWFGTANPNPWGGSRRYPNGGMYPGPVRYTDSIVELDIRTGRLIWSDQVTPHDVRDYDFQDPPVLARNLAIGAGKAGRVIAWDRSSRKRVWATAVGLHRHDTGALPTKPTSVCPGLLGGVETPLAVAGGRVFVPVVDLCFKENAYGTSLGSFLAADYTKGKGALTALDLKSGALLWSIPLPSPDFGCATVSNDVVFTDTYAGTLLAVDASTGKVLWRTATPAAVNACPAVAGARIVLPTAAAYPKPRTESDEVVAYALPPS